MLGNVFVIILLSVVMIDVVVMSIFCRIMEKIDGIREKKRKNRLKEVTSETENVSQSKLIIRVAKQLLDHYLYGLMRYSVLVVGKIPSHTLRNIIYRVVFCMKITRKTVIYGGSEIRSPWRFKANNCVLSNNCLLDCRNGIILGDNVVFGGGVHIWTEEHDVNSPYFAVSDNNRGPVIIDSRAWICSDSTILPGVHVGEGAVLASRACATKDLEPYGIYAGIPAKKIGERTHDLRYELKGKPHWHFY